MSGGVLPRGIVAVIRTGRPEDALILGRGFLTAGVPGVEVTMTVPDAPRVVADLAPGAAGRVGAGTVRTAAQVDECVRAGAAYIVAPNLDRTVVDRAIELGVPCVPGALTPSEMTAAVAAGAAAVKVFPIEPVGGLTYLRAVLEPLPELEVVASGGIAVEQVRAYLDAGAVSVCLGRSLVDEAALAAGDVDGVADFAASVLATCGVAALTSSG